jgi:hypothetical protein
MVSQNNERVVSCDPASPLQIVSRKDSVERNLPDHAQECGQTPAQSDSLGQIRIAIHPGEANGKAISPGEASVTFIDRVERAIHRVEKNRSDQRILAAKEKLLSPTVLYQLYAGTSVPAHRYLSGLLSSAVRTSAIMPEPSRWLASIPKANLSGVVEAWLSTCENTEYEQLNSIGLDARTSRLTGVVRVKQRSGYLGGASTAGSREYVAFWVDWGSGFQYEGTTSVAVHDFSSLPSVGLEYKVFLPVDIRALVKPGGKGATRVNVRAVL